MAVGGSCSNKISTHSHSFPTGRNKAETKYAEKCALLSNKHKKITWSWTGRMWALFVCVRERVPAQGLDCLESHSVWRPGEVCGTSPNRSQRSTPDCKRMQMAWATVFAGTQELQMRNPQPGEKMGGHRKKIKHPRREQPHLEHWQIPFCKSRW